MALKKSLSQNLLKDKNLLDKMVRLADIERDDVVIEIGAGQGDLTRAIMARARFVHAIELDRQFAPQLQQLEQSSSNLKVTFGSVLAIPFGALAGCASVKVMGNIPYNITGDILFKLLYEMDVVKSAHLTMQKEVGERLVSAPFARAYGALSVIFQLHASVKLLLRLKPSLFLPPPEVESAFVAILFKQSGVRPEPGLIDFIKTCFRYKRKYLRHSLEVAYDAARVQDLYSFMGFGPSTRAEEVDPEGFRKMYEFLKGSVGPKVTAGVQE